MARKKDTPQKAALREMMSNYLKENNVKVKDGTDVNSIMRDMYISNKLTSSHGQSDHLSQRFRSLIPERYSR